jgi:hypothetical protein
MSTRIADGDIIKCTFVVQGLDGQVALPSIYYQGGFVSGSGGTIADLIGQLDVIAGTDLLAIMANAAAYRGVLGQRIFPLPITVRETDSGSAGNGTGGATLAPMQAAPVIGWETPLAGPSQRGRFYVPFMPGDKVNVTTGELAVLYHGAVQTFANDLVTVAIAGTGGNQTVVNQVIWHRNLLNADIISAGVARFKIGTQKRRGNYGKQNLSPI